MIDKWSEEKKSPENLVLQWRVMLWYLVPDFMTYSYSELTHKQLLFFYPLDECK